MCVLCLTACQTTSAGFQKSGQVSGSSHTSLSESPSEVLADVTAILDHRGGEAGISPEDLLEADGNMNIIEQTPEEPDPSSEHLKAREHVDTSRKTKSASLAPRFDPDLAPEKDNRFRVLKIQKGDMKDTKLASAITVPQTVPERVTESVITFEPEPADPMKAVLEASTVVPARKPSKADQGAVEVAMTSKPVRAEESRAPLSPVVVPVHKPVYEDRRPEQIASIEPAAGLNSHAVPVAPVVPAKKPAVAKSRDSDDLGGSKIPIPRPKTSFMAVNLKPLNAEVSSPGSPGRGDVIKVRSGEHSGKTRIVFDISGDARFDAKLDHARKVLVVDLQNAEWSADEHVQFHALSIVSGYRVQPLSDGATRIELSLKKDTKLLQAVSFGTDAKGITRIVLDLKNG
ncbi:MAG: hypothetical protein KDI61_07790 [Alphaproteobacteria bacterium]|nr:hypothetical protein [Alphaproteobacteria bacterium]